MSKEFSQFAFRRGLTYWARARCPEAATVYIIIGKDNLVLPMYWRSNPRSHHCFTEFICRVSVLTTTQDLSGSAMLAQSYIIVH